MSDVTSSMSPEAVDPQGLPAKEPPHAQPQRRPSMFADPMVKLMVVVAFSLVVLYLAGILGAMLFAGLGSNVPRTGAEKALDSAQSIVQAGDHSPKATADYVNALIDVNQFGKAQRVIDSAPDTAMTSPGGDVLVAQARLYLAQKDYKSAITAADKAMKSVQTQFKAALKKSGTTYAKAYGIDPGYWSALLIKGMAQQTAGDSKAAVASYDEYLKGNPMDSSVLVRRGQVKVDLKDTAGARADFQAALKYVPDDPTANAELKKIGAK